MKHPKFIELATLLAKDNCSTSPICVVRVGYPGVLIPWKYKNYMHIKLQVGYDMNIPIFDLSLNQYGWSGTLMFETVPFRCVVPWGSVVAIVDTSKVSTNLAIVPVDKEKDHRAAPVYSLAEYRKKSQRDNERDG